MKKTSAKRNCLLLLPVIMILVGALPANGQERSVEEFKKYLNERIQGQVDDAVIELLAKAVDADGDGQITQEEFDNRQEAFRSALGQAGGSAGGAVRKQPKYVAPDKVIEIPALTDSDQADVLLITSGDLAQAWLPFARWKTSAGKLTRIVTVGQINRDYEGNSIQEKIRQCVRKHIDNHNTQWVILGGDSLSGGLGVVPGGHRTYHRSEPQGIPTDLVYLSPTDWDADKDGIYGEFEDDRQAITYPDGSVGLGRIPVRTAKGVAAFTAKVIEYESQYPTTEFATTMVYTCTDRPAYPKVRNSWDSYVSKVWNGKVSRFFSDETPWDDQDEPGSFALSADNLVDLFNQKSTGKLHIHGHGHLPVWALEGRSTFSGQHANQLSNKGAYPLITTVSCNTGEFDSRQDPSIVEQMLRIPNAGSVAIVAPIRTGKAHFASQSDFRLMVTEGKLDGTTMTMTRYWTHGLGQQETTGHAIMKAKRDMAEQATQAPAYHLCVCELNLLGDPTLDMRSKSPRNPEFTATASSKDGQVHIKVSSDAPGSTVCLWDKGDQYQVAEADKNGNASFVTGAANPELRVSISGANLNVVSKAIQSTDPS